MFESKIALGCQEAEFDFCYILLFIKCKKLIRERRGSQPEGLESVCERVLPFRRAGTVGWQFLGNDAGRIVNVSV